MKYLKKSKLNKKRTIDPARFLQQIIITILYIFFPTAIFDEYRKENTPIKKIIIITIYTLITACSIIFIYFLLKGKIK